MKKIGFVLALLMVMCCGAVQAQDTVSNHVSFFKQDPFLKRQLFYIKAGLAISNSYYTRWNKSLKFKPGEDVLIGYNRNIDKSRFYFGGEIGFTTRGWSGGEMRVREFINFKDCGQALILEHGFKFGPNVGFRHMIANKYYLDYHFGAYAAYYFAGVNGLETDDLFNFFWDVRQSCNLKWDGGLSLGVAFWYNRLCFDITYQNGFAPWLTYDAYPSQVDYKHSIQFKVGIAF